MYKELNYIDMLILFRLYVGYNILFCNHHLHWPNRGQGIYQSYVGSVVQYNVNMHLFYVLTRGDFSNICVCILYVLPTIALESAQIFYWWKTGFPNMWWIMLWITVYVGVLYI